MAGLWEVNKKRKKYEKEEIITGVCLSGSVLPSGAESFKRFKNSSSYISHRSRVFSIKLRRTCGNRLS